MRSLILIAGLVCFNLYAQVSTSIPQMVQNDCLGCHNIPIMYYAPMISGQNREFLEFELTNFRDYVRDHEIMNQVMENFTDEDIKEIASYISSLSICEAQAPVEQHPHANIKKGEQLFKASCISCHSKDPSGFAPVIHGQKTLYLEEAIQSFQSTWYAPRPSRIDMRSHTDMLSEQDIKDVSAYLNVQKLCE